MATMPPTKYVSNELVMSLAEIGADVVTVGAVVDAAVPTDMLVAAVELPYESSPANEAIMV